MADTPLKVLVVDENRLRASIIEEGLREAGGVRVTIVSELGGLMKRVVEIDPDVIVIDLGNPDRDALESLFHVSRAAARPVAMFVDRSDSAMIEAAVDAGVSAYVVDGLRKERVKPILDMAISRFNAFSRLRDELDKTRQALEERKVIDRAKGILMKRRKLSEEEAYALLRRSAMNENRRIAEVAESVVIAASLFSGEDR
ncbi:MAG: ANTAR domain-containing protein [Hyphomicrobiales bacterium]